MSDRRVTRALTPKRLDLLLDIEDRWVFQDTLDGVSRNGRTSARVTAKVAELEAAGWVELEPKEPMKRSRKWRLTAAGEAVLAKHRRQR